MRSLNKFVIILVFSCVSAQALAVDPPGWIGPVQIESLVVQPNGRIYVQIVGATPDIGCTGNVSGWLELDTAAPFFKEQYAMLLAVHAAEKTVKIYVNGCGWYPYAQNTHFE